MNPDEMPNPREGTPPDDSLDDAVFDAAPHGAPPFRVPPIDAGRSGALLAGPALFEQGSDAHPAARPAPSLPIILISSACGVAGGVFGLYISYGLLDWGIAWSAGAATLGLLFGLGISGAALSAITGERGALVNMAFSCTLLVLVALFMGMCAVAGAAVATLLVGV